MAHKPEIQYVERFYVYGSEAPAKKLQEEQQQMQRRPAKQQVTKIYVDLSAILWTGAALLLILTMVLSAVHLNTMWQERDLMQSYVNNLQLNNSTLQHNYRISYNLEDIEAQALELGLVPEDQVETKYIRVTVPHHEEQWTTWGNIQWFFEGLFE